MATLHAFSPETDRNDVERALRVDLAACYRLIALYGMDDLVYTHISMRLPGPEHRFLLNPYGMTFDEIRASDLLVVDLDGRVEGTGPYDVNQAGFTIHSAIHMGRDDAICVIHTHALAGMAIAALEDELLMLNQMSMQFHGRLAYHAYEGIAFDLTERERLLGDLGDKPAMVLRNHGLITVGRTAAEAFHRMYYLNMSCRIQLETQKTGAPMRLPPPHVVEHAAAQFSQDDVYGDRMWPAMLRKLDRLDRSYRD